MTFNRRNCLHVALASTLLAATGSARATDVTLEIIAFAHPPVQSALKPLRDWLPRQGGAIKLIEIDMDSPQAQQRLLALGLKGHLPIVLVINGLVRHKRADGSQVEFVSFPVAAGTATATRAWSVEEAKAVLSAATGR